MSLATKPDATVEGLAGPYFPDAIMRLNAVLSDRRMGWVVWMLKEAIEDHWNFKVCGYDSSHLKTADGYTWQAMIEVREKAGKVIIAVPWLNDRSNADNSNLDRSAAAYIPLPEELRPDVEAAITRLSEGLEKYRDDLLGLGKP